MKKYLSKTLLIICVSCMTGCVSYKNISKKDAHAKIKGDSIAFDSKAGHKKNTMIVKVDGLSAAGNVRVKPGAHSITFRVGDSTSWEQGDITFNFQSGKTYKIQALRDRYMGKKIRIQILETDSGTVVHNAAFIPTESGGRPVHVYITY